MQTPAPDGWEGLGNSQVFIADGKCYSWSLWSRLKPSASGSDGGDVAIPCTKGALSPPPAPSPWLVQGTLRGLEGIPPQPSSCCVLVLEDFLSPSLTGGDISQDFHTIR